MPELLTATREMSYPALLRHRAHTEPDAVAIRRAGSDELTFAGWFDRAQAFASTLLDAGHGPGARIGLLFHNEGYFEYAIATMAGLLAGAAVAPLSRASTDADMRRAVARASIDVVVHATDVEPPLGLPLLRFGEANAIADHELFFSPDDETLAEILFTSGSTGEPKAIAVTHRGLKAELPVDHSSGPRRDITLHAVPIGTNWGQVMVRQALARRASMIVMDRFDADDAVATIAAERPTELAISPAMAGLLLDAELDGYDLSSLRQISLSSAPTHRSTIEALQRSFPTAIVACFYSSTEACPAQAELRCPPDPPTVGGRASEGTEIRVVDEQGTACALGAVGAVQLRTTRGVPRRHLDGTPVATVDGWVAPGDLGSIDADGFLTLIGRASDLVNFGGSKVHCGEVEAVLLDHPAVSDVAVFGIDAPVVGQEVAAAAVVDTQTTTDHLLEFASERLSPYKVPTRIARMPRLPRTAAGKVDKGELRRWLDTVPRDLPDAVTTTGDIERHLLEVWRGVLADRDLSSDARLIDHGASSLSAFVVIARLRQRLDVEVPPSSFLRCRTVIEQAQLISAL